MAKNQINGEKVSSPQRQSVQEKNRFVQVPLEVLEAGISTSAMKLYLILLKYARQSNECWPSQQTLGWDMNLKPRRIADLLKELEEASLITIICRAKEGLSNLYRLLKVVLPKGCSSSSSSKVAKGAARNDIPGKQRIAGEGLQNIADESQALEKHALRTHTHIQGKSAKELLSPTEVPLSHSDKSVCDLRGFGEETNLKRAVLKREGESVSLHIPLIDAVLGKVKSVLTGFGVSEVKARQLAATVTHAKLDETYIEGLIDWIGEQATSRTIYNPAGLLVQMACQLAPVPQPRGARVPTLNDLQVSFEQKKKFVEEQLPQIIAIEERNLRESKTEGDKERIQARLNMLLDQQAKEGRNLVKETVYLADRKIEFSAEYLSGQTSLQQYSDRNFKGGYLNAATY